MNRGRLLLILGGLTGILAILVLGGPLLVRLGIEPLCIQGAWPHLEVVRCPLVSNTSLPLETDTPRLLTRDAGPVIVDTDMAPDDWMAILYLLRQPGVDVKAITVTGVGEVHCDAGVRHALNLAALAGRPDTPVSCGRQTPLQGNHEFPSAWRDRADTLAGLSLPPNTAATTASTSSRNAVQLLSNSLRGSERKVTIVALGPLTNLAEAFTADPALVQRIEMVYIMGGAFRVKGNVALSNAGINNEAAEWNIYIDPHAAQVVLQSGAPLTLVPLDATSQVPISESFYRRLSQVRTTSSAEFVFQLLTKQYDMIKQGLYWFWDPLAAAISVDESLARYDMAAVAVVAAEGPDVGATRIVAGGAPVRMAVTADHVRFEEQFLEVLSHE